MNYLSHHVVAREVAALTTGDADPAFYIGNVLPDLLSVSGDGRLRAQSVLAPPSGVRTSLVNGIRLHLAADTRFHGHPLFTEATREASDTLRATPFSLPLRRVFFLAHAFVEVALDGWLIRQEAGIATDFYAQFERSDLSAIITDAGRLLGREAPLIGLAHTMERFVEAKYLFSYADESGMAEALYRVCHRAGIADLLADPSDRALLGDCFASFLPRIAAKAEELLAPPASISMIQ